MKPINSVPEKEEKMWGKEFPAEENAFYWKRHALNHEDVDIGILINGSLYFAEGTSMSKSRRQDFEFMPASPSDTEELLALRGQLNNAADLEMLARDEINALREAAEVAYQFLLDIGYDKEMAVCAKLRKALGKE